MIREVLYQRITFKQRRPLHKQVSDAIKTMPNLEYDPDIEG